MLAPPLLAAPPRHGGYALFPLSPLSLRHLNPAPYNSQVTQSRTPRLALSLSRPLPHSRDHAMTPSDQGGKVVNLLSPLMSKRYGRAVRWNVLFSPCHVWHIRRGEKKEGGWVGTSLLPFFFNTRVNESLSQPHSVDVRRQEESYHMLCSRVLWYSVYLSLLWPKYTEKVPSSPPESGEDCKIL